MKTADELWREMAAASDAVAAAECNWSRADTPESRATLEAAARRLIATIGPLAGDEVASNYNIAFGAFVDAVHRHEQFLATLSTQTAIDEADRQLSDHLAADTAAAIAALEAPHAAVVTRLKEIADWEE